MRCATPPQGLKGRALPGPHDYEQIPELAERGRKRLEHFFRDMDARLSGRAFVAGDRYTIADISALIVVDFAGRLKLTVPEECANLRRWYAAVSAKAEREGLDAALRQISRARARCRNFVVASAHATKRRSKVEPAALLTLLFRRVGA